MKNIFKEFLVLAIMTVVIMTGLKFTAINYINHHPEIAEMQVVSYERPRPREVYTSISAYTIEVKKPLDN